ILVAETALVGDLVIEAGSDRERSLPQLRGPAPATVDAEVVAVQIDRAAVVKRSVALHRHWHRQRLRGLAVATVGGHCIGMAGRQVLFDARTELVLTHGLTGLERQRTIAGGASVA